MISARVELCFWFLVIAVVAAGSELKRRYDVSTPPPAQGRTSRLEPILQEVPARVVNAPPQRVIGPDGAPLIDHSSGW